jgi:hypothetical protein
MELEKVLQHYSKDPKDSLKLKAAEFLIENMKYHYTFEHKELRSYYNEIIKINNDTCNALACRQKIDSLKTVFSINEGELEIKYDIRTINAEYLIQNIEQAMESWCKFPWLKHLSFNEFCEYILPYRIGNENLELWRSKLAGKYL